LILLDTHVVVWMRAQPDRLSQRARTMIEGADGLAISDITLWELAMLVSLGRLEVGKPVGTYLGDVSRTSTVLPITAAVATEVADLPSTFPTKDPADRLIYATAQVHGIPLLSADGRLNAFDDTVIWD